jgi:hypothetical protein
MKLKIGDEVKFFGKKGRIVRKVKAKYTYDAVTPKFPKHPAVTEFRKGQTVYEVGTPVKRTKLIFNVKAKDLKKVV